jgi:hypothetical protein
LVCLIPEMFHGVIDLLHLQTMIFHNSTGKSASGRDGEFSAQFTYQGPLHTSPSRYLPCRIPEWFISQPQIH